MKVMIIVSLVFVLGSCSAGRQATRNPEFYPNDHYKKVGALQAHDDTRYCMSLADDYVKDPSRFKQGSKNVAGAAAAGSAAGAVAGAILKGSIGRSVGAGAASAAVVQILRELAKAGDQSPGWEKFVEKCLEEKGYKIYDWS